MGLSSSSPGMLTRTSLPLFGASSMASPLASVVDVPPAPPVPSLPADPPSGALDELVQPAKASSTTLTIGAFRNMRPSYDIARTLDARAVRR
jgi:hypothetical protein